MDSFQAKLAKQVRQYKHLYDPSSRDYRDIDMAIYAWNEIATTLGKDEAFCRKVWKNMRDRFVRAKKKIYVKTSHRRRIRVIPTILMELDWLSQFTKHRETDNNLEDDGEGCTQVHKAPQDFSTQDDPVSPPCDPDLPLSSLRLLVPPLRLMSACMWQVAQERNVDQYDKLAEFITLVTELVPELLDYKQAAQLILGLRARLILEFMKGTEVDCNAIEDHLNSFQQRTTNHVHDVDKYEEVETSKSAFVELVQTLLRDQSEKDKYFKEVFSEQYGTRFDTALQILVWEFFYRLEEFLPVPSFSQVFAMCDISSLDCKFEQFVSEPEDLKRILQHQRERQKLTKSDFAFMSDTILSTLASKQTLVGSEDPNDQKITQKTVKQEDDCSIEDTYEDDEETDDSSIEANPNSRHEYGLSPPTSSPSYEKSGAAGDDEAAEEAAFQPPRCSAEGLKERLSRDEEPSEETMNQSLTGIRADAGENPDSANENTYLERSKIFASCASLKKKEVDSLIQQFKCTECNKSYNSQQELNQHFLIHSKPKVPPLTCNVCQKRFMYQASLKAHLRRHSGERPYACSYCDKRFRTSCVLKSHVRIHTGERPYACTICGKRFIQPYTRTVHLRMHKKERPYLCSTCGMSFCSSGALLVHSRNHTGERPYQCDLCGKSFTKSERLRVHRRYHTGERPYSCSQCAKSFHCSSGLKKHMRTHTGEKPYQCSTCHKTFSLKSNLKVHLKVHRNL